VKDSVQGDNQQATIEEVCWLAGIIDAEGHIGVHKWPGKNKPTYRSTLTVTNGNEAIIWETVRIMDLLGVNPAVREVKKVYYSVALSAPTKIERLLKRVIPYLAEKQVLARKMAIFCKSKDPNLAEQIIAKDFYRPEKADALSPHAAKAWLAGFMDGDGSIGVYKMKQPEAKGGYSYSARAKATNNDRLSIDRVEKILEDNDISYSENHQTYNGRNALNVVIAAKESMRKFLEMIKDLLVGKKPQAELALRFLRARSQSSISDREQDYLKSRELNAPIGASLATREAGSIA